MANIEVGKTTENGKTIVVNRESEKTLATLKMPIDWEVKDAIINRQKSTLEIPYAIIITLANKTGSSIIIDSGDSFASQGKVAYFHEQAPHTLQHNFVTVDKYLDEYVHNFAKQNNKSIRFKDNLDIPLHNYDGKADFIKHRNSIEQETQRAAAASGGRIVINGLYCDSACRMYSSDDVVIVAYAREVGSQTSMTNLGMFGGDGMNNIIQELGGLIKIAKDKTISAAKNDDGGGSLLNRMADNGLLSDMLGSKKQSQPKRKVEQPAANNPENENEGLVSNISNVNNDELNYRLFGRMNEPRQGEWLEWKAGPVFLLVTPKEGYEEIVKKAFRQICSSFKLSPEVIREHQKLQMRMEQDENHN